MGKEGRSLRAGAGGLQGFISTFVSMRTYNVKARGRWALAQSSFANARGNRAAHPGRSNSSFATLCVARSLGALSRSATARPRLLPTVQSRLQRRQHPESLSPCPCFAAEPRRLLVTGPPSLWQSWKVRRLVLEAPTASARSRIVKKQPAPPLLPTADRVGLPAL